MINPFTALQSFIEGAKQRHGPNFDPEAQAKNMPGYNPNINTPQEALSFLLQSGKINKQQYNMYLKML